MNQNSTFNKKTPLNIAEGIFHTFINSEELRATKRGWPDFAIYSTDGDFFCVEVKPSKSEDLRESQYDIIEKLSQYGIPCFKFSPDVGFVIIGKRVDGTITLCNKLNNQWLAFKAN